MWKGTKCGDQVLSKNFVLWFYSRTLRAFKLTTNRSDRPAYPDILSTVSTSPIIDFFSYTFLLTEICSISWSFRRNSFFFCEAFLTLSLTLEIEERDLRDLLFFLPNHSFMNSHEELKKARKIYSIFWCFLFKAFLTEGLTPRITATKIFVKPFIHEGFASYFYGCVQGGFKGAPVSPQKSVFCWKWSFLWHMY